MEFIERIYIINLDRRTDRYAESIQMLTNAGINMSKVERISAVPHPVGAVGCAMSHITTLCRAQYLHATQHGSPYVLIMEDDADFAVSLHDIEQVIKNTIFRNNFKVLMLATSPFEHCSVPLQETDSVHEIIFAKTAAAYIIHASYMDRLAQLMASNAAKLMQTHHLEKYSCDLVWQIDMGRNSGFYCPATSMVHQRMSYSDILNKPVTYKEQFEYQKI